MKLLPLFAALLFFFITANRASADLPDDLADDNTTPYQIRLINGDVLTGTIMGFVNDSTEGDGVRFRTVIGKAVIYSSQIAEIVATDEVYRHNHRLFLMPSADPIGKNCFAGLFELLFLYAGAGFGPASLTAGRSIIPGIASNEQLSLMNFKYTFAREPNETMPGGFSAAAGVNLAWANNANQLIHPYLTATFTLTRTRVSASLFGKFGGAGNAFIVSASRYGDLPVNYSNGSIGLALGIDTRFSERHDIHFIGEFWNADLERPIKSAAMLGLRLCNTTISADFGVSFFTAPAIAPYCGFAWTPF